MRCRRSTEIQRVDLDPALRLVPAAIEAWRGLRFDGGGRLLHGSTGRATDGIRLESGRHGHPGSTYLFDLDVLAPRPPRQGSDQPAPPRGCLRWTTSGSDGDDRIRGTLADQHGRWQVELDIGAHAGTTPDADLSWRVALTDVLVAMEAGPRFWLNRLTGRGTGRARVQAGPLVDRSGSLVVADGKLRSGAGHLQLDVDPSPSSWGVSLDASLHGRGLGRLVFLVAGGAIRRGIERRLDDLVAGADEKVAALDAALTELDDRVRRAGGERAFVDQVLWTEWFPPGG